jgi:hypothetical protein
MERYTGWVTSTVHRSIGLATLVLLALLPLGRTACEVICAPALHVGVHAADGRSAGQAPACHDSADPAAVSLSGIQDHGCGDHAAGAANAAAWLKAGRFDAGARSLELLGPGAPGGQPAAPLGLPPAGPSTGPPLHIHAAITSVVLRI